MDSFIITIKTLHALPNAKIQPMQLTSETDLSKLTVVILKKELESRGLDNKGKKADLIERLSEVLKNDKVASPSKSTAAAPSIPLKPSSPTTKSATAATASSPVKQTESSKTSMTPASPVKTANATTVEKSSDGNIKTKAALGEKMTVPGAHVVEKKNASPSKQPQSPLKVEINVAGKKVNSPIKSSMQSTTQQIASPTVKAASPAKTLKRTADESLSPSKKARKAMDEDQGRDLDGVLHYLITDDI